MLDIHVEAGHSNNHRIKIQYLVSLSELLKADH